VLGKGASAAFHMSKIQGFVQSLSTQITDPPELLERLNSLIEKNFDSEFFFTALYGVFDVKKKFMDIYRMGHNGLIYYNHDENSTIVLEPPGIGFGLADCQKFRKSLKHKRIGYKPGDIFAFLTDGYLEVMDVRKQSFGEENICRLIQEHHQKSASEIMDVLTKEINRFSNNIQSDDTTGIIIKILDEK
jgi:serine phosphatase RsbU (regulator of sigma subunit)